MSNYGKVKKDKPQGHQCLTCPVAEIVNGLSMIKNYFICIFAAFFLMKSGAFAEVYSWKDEKGSLVYGDRPPNSNHAKKKEVDPVNLMGGNYCLRYKDIAATAMRYRQGGTSRDAALALAGSELGRYLTVKAYNSPQFSTKKYRTEQAREFSQEAYDSCRDKQRKADLEEVERYSPSFTPSEEGGRKNKACLLIYKIAIINMEMRQDGISRYDIKDDKIKKLAFLEPIQASALAKKKATYAFAEKIYKACIKEELSPLSWIHPLRK